MLLLLVRGGIIVSFRLRGRIDLISGYGVTRVWERRLGGRDLGMSS